MRRYPGLVRGPPACALAEIVRCHKAGAVSVDKRLQSRPLQLTQAEFVARVIKTVLTSSIQRETRRPWLMSRAHMPPRPGLRSGAAGLLAVVAFAVASGAAALANGADSPANLPVSILPKGDGAVMQMSLGQWETYMRRLDQQKINEARGLAEGPLSVPRTPKSNRDFEVWNRTEADAAALSPELGTTRNELGAAIDVGGGFNVGVARQVEETANAETSTARLGVAGNIMLDEWRLVPKAQLSGSSVTAPSGPASSSDGLSGDASTASGAVSETATVEFTPELRRAFKVDDNRVAVEPFLRLESRFAFAGGEAPDDYGALSQETLAGSLAKLPVDKVGIGIAVTEPDSYRFEASTDIEPPATPEGDSGISSRMKLSVPLD